MEYITDTELDKEFLALGRFYEIKYKKHPKEKCRSILEIYNKRNYKNTKKSKNFDAVFVMMNPGASKPKNYESIKVTTVDEIERGILLTVKLVETIPDRTQYQIMRIMKEKQWNYVKVINLSDLREANSNIFCEKIKDDSKFKDDNIHSIFSKKRISELDDVFVENQNYKVIVAWSVNTKLNKLIKLALDSSKLEHRIGFNQERKIKKDFYYYHPLQRGLEKQIKWLENILEKLE